ncbi:hypothetical protein ES705_09195 [subsurface metagenome]
MRICAKKIKIIAICLIIGAAGYTQSSLELEKKKDEALKEINYTNKLLEQTQKNRRTSLNNLILLKNKIKRRKNLISSINEEIKLISETIKEKESVIKSLEEDVKKIRKQYEVMIYFAYRNKKYKSNLSFIFEAENFNQAYKRIKYLQKVAEFRQKQAKLIQRLQKVLTDNIEDLEEDKKEKELLLVEEQKEWDKLNREKGEENRLVVKLQKEEKQLRRKLREKRRIAKKLEKEIERLIAEEARKAQGLDRLTPEQKLIADNFRSNKGRLPWPTERGIITEKFGLQNHEILKGVQVRNNGVDIATSQGATARTVFEGEVRKIIAIPGANQAVIIRHGNYLSVYQNLVNVAVKTGDNVGVKEGIGTVFTDTNNDNKTVLHFEIWEENKKLDPSVWLSNYQ